MSGHKLHKLNIVKTKRLQWLIIVISILIYISFYIPVPFFVTMPGSAIELDTIVEVQQGYSEKGSFMLTTISMMPANISSFFYSQLSTYMELIPENLVLAEDEDPEEYSQRQLKIMKESQENAIIAAFKYLDLPIEIKDRGILVMGTIPGLPGEKFLQVGDLIVEVDKKPMKKVDDLLAYLKTKEAGNLVEVSYLRNDKINTNMIPLVNLSTELDINNDDLPEKKVGIGFYPSEEREVIPSKQVTFKTEEIGGPSAGFMFTLEIINQLTPNDLTKGYQIAGTGTIGADGKIGQIGGAKLKVKAAYQQGAEIFFVPKDITAENTNQKDAERSNLILGKPLKVVPVSNIKEAMDFLQTLPPKEVS